MDSQDVMEMPPARKVFARMPGIRYRFLAMASVVYLTNRAPARLIGDLMMLGTEPGNASASQRCSTFASRQLIDAVVIAADVEDAEVVEAQMRHITNPPQA